jgi:hypothetical protein
VTEETTLDRLDFVRGLCDYLDSFGPGPITDTGRLGGMLSSCWDELDGSDQEGMTSFKLHGRVEDATWNPPLLRFSIERHGATVRGSSRAERHGWTLDLQTKTATWERLGFRQVRPAARRLDVQALADAIFQLILEGQMDERLKWYEDGTVRVQIGKVIPENSAVKQTLAGRRKRFRAALTELILRDGGESLSANVYRLPR